MTLADQYYVEFLLGHNLSVSNKILLAEALAYPDNIEFSYIQMLEAMIVANEYPSVSIYVAVANQHHKETIHISEEDVMYLLNSFVCKTEFAPDITSKYVLRQYGKAKVALETLMQQFKIYIIHGLTKNKQELPMKSDVVKK